MSFSEINYHGDGLIIIYDKELIYFLERNVFPLNVN